MKTKHFLLCCIAVLCSISTFAHDFEVNGIYYKFLGGDSVAVSNESGDDNSYSANSYSARSVFIPETVSYNYTTYRVTTIGESAFYGCSSLKYFTISNSVTTIGDNAFSGCSSLTEVTIPNSVTAIGARAFEGCYNVKTIIVESGNPTYYSAGNCLIETASKTLISGCKNSVIPNDGSVTTIGDCAFEDCSSLTSITIPNSVTNIGDYAFRYCSSLTEVTIPNSVTSIGEGAFSGCKNLTSITMPNSITTIENRAFAGCTALTSIIIPYSVTFIGNSAFENTGIKAVIWNAKNCINYDNTSYSNEDNAPFYEIASGITSFTFGNEVERIPAYLCNGMSNLTEITIPESVTYIGKLAFNGCSGLTSINIPESVTTIGYRAFCGCHNITSITIPSRVRSIGSAAFYIQGLKSVIWNAKNCQGFKENATPFYYYVPSGAIWTDYLVDEYPRITSFTFGDDVESIPNHLCRAAPDPRMSYITSVTIGNNVTSIGDYAFYRCELLESINIPNSVTSIGDHAFNGCGLTSISIGNSVDHIGDYALSCPAKSLTLPHSVSLIGDHAFSSKLENLTILATKPPFIYYTHTLGISSSTKITIPCGTRYEYLTARRWGELYEDQFQEDFLFNFSATSDDNQKGTVSITQTPHCGNSSIAKVEASPRRGYKFLQWNDGDKNAVRKVKVEQDLELIAYFDTAIVESIALNESELTLVKGETTQLIATITPEEVINKNILWSTSDSTIITVQDGLITAIEAGEATITAATEEEAYTASCKVTVILPNALDDVEIDTSTQVRKVFENGTIYILRNGEKYTIDGRKVE